MNGVVYQCASQWHSSLGSEQDPATGKYPWITEGGFRTETEAWKAHSQAHFPSNVALLVAQIENHASSSRYEPTRTNGGETESKIVTVARDGLVMLTAHEVRAMTGVPVSTLHDWAAKRERGIVAPGPHHLRLSDRHRRWLLDDVKEWLESTRV